VIDLHCAANNVSGRANNSLKILIIDCTGGGAADNVFQRILFSVETMRDEILI
jgi:hypothetical protein